jgi:Holliday junction resolvase
MSTQPEARISKAIMAALRARGIFCFKVHGSAEQMTGLPDILACVEGRFVGFETKMPDKRQNVSARQIIVHKAIQASQGIAVVVCGVKEAMGIVDELHLAAKRRMILGTPEVTALIADLQTLISTRKPDGPVRTASRAAAIAEGEINGLNMAIRILKGEQP